MSSTSAIADSGKFTNAAGGGAKMSFSQTCNLLSQYVKEKRARGSLLLLSLLPDLNWAEIELAIFAGLYDDLIEWLILLQGR